MQVRQKAAAILNALIIMTGSDWLFLASIVWFVSLLVAMVWVLFGM